LELGRFNRFLRHVLLKEENFRGGWRTRTDREKLLLNK